MKNYLYLFVIYFILISCSSNSDDTILMPVAEDEIVEENNIPSAVALSLISQDCEAIFFEWTAANDPDPDDSISYEITVNNDVISNNVINTNFTIETSNFTFPIVINVTAQDNRGGESETSNMLNIEEQVELISFTNENLKQALLVNPENIDKNADGEISICEAFLFDGELNIMLQEINDISDLVFFDNASVLDARGNSITNVAVLTDLNFETIALGFNNLTEFNMGLNDSVKDLFLDNNQLKTVDLTLYPSLERTFLLNNELTSVDFTNNPDLISVSAGGNQISILDISQNPELTSLDAGSNLITIIDITNNPQLTRFSIGNNPITSIFTENNPNLEELLVPNTFIEFLDISSNQNLQLVWAQDNPVLTGINISNGNNSGVTRFFAHRSPELSCVQVDDVNSIPENWVIDNDITSFSTDCQF